jgi:chitodextrinase
MGLPPNTTFFYRIRSFNAAGDSAYSNETSATTPSAIAPPAAPSNLTTTTVATNQVGLAWTDNSDNEDNFRIERSTGLSGTWAEIATVAAGVTTFSDTGVSPQTAYSYRVRAHNAGGDSAYSNEVSVTTPPVPPGGGINLALSNCDISPVAPVKLAPGDPLILSAFVENTGGNTAGPFWTEVWGSRTGGLALDRFLVTSLHLESLPGGGAYSWVTSEPLYSIPDGPYTVVYAVDRPGEVAETNERDNRTVVRAKRILVLRPPTPVDLAVEGFAVSPNPAQSGGPVSFAGRVINRGSQASGPFWIEFWGSWDWPYPNLNFFLCDSIYVGNLDAGAAIALSAYPRTLYGVPEGVFMVGCFADRDDAINELDETNNFQFVDGQVFNRTSLVAREAALASGADIVIRSADVSPASPAELAPGSTITLTVEVANIGTGDTGPFWLEYWGSRTGGVTLSDFLADSTHFANLAPGQTVRLTMVKRLYGVPDGPYSVVVFADRPGDVSETNEANNRLTVAGKRLLVIRPPTGANLTLSGFDCHPNFANVALNGIVRNTGTGDSGPFWVEFWACPDDPDYPRLDRFLCDSIRMSNLAPAEEVDLSTLVRLIYPTVPQGRYAVICFVDRLDQVAETDETDNYAIVRNVQVQPH